MTKRISTREWEAISAYLDNQLSARERLRLEANLQTSPELRTALEEMRRTRAVLRSQPRLRAPRNFTLTPAMVGKRRVSEPRAYPFLRLASAMAAVLFVLVFVGDLFYNAPIPQVDRPVTFQHPVPTVDPGVGAAGMAPEEQALMLPEAREAEEAAPLMGEPDEKTIPDEEQAGDAAAGATEPEAFEAMEEPAAEEAPAMEAMEAPAEQAAPAGEAAPAEQPEAAEQALPAEERAMESALIEAAPPAVGVEQAAEVAPVINQNTLRILEAVLLLLALATGMLAYYLRRKAVR